MTVKPRCNCMEYDHGVSEFSEHAHDCALVLAGLLDQAGSGDSGKAAGESRVRTISPVENAATVPPPAPESVEGVVSHNFDLGRDRALTVDIHGASDWPIGTRVRVARFDPEGDSDA